MSQRDSTPDSRVVMDVGEGQVAQEAGSWSIRRSLSGGGLPGQARAVSGSSVGSGQVQIVSPAGRSPWTPGPIRPGGRVGIEARADVDRPWSSVAQMTARSVSGTARSQALDVDVEDDLGGLLGPATLESAVAADPGGYTWDMIDVAHAVERVAMRAGYRSTAPGAPGLRMLLSVPLTGSTMPEVGTYRSGRGPSAGAWVERDGRVCRRGESAQYLIAGEVDRYVTVTLRTYGPATVPVIIPSPYATGGGYRYVRLARTAWGWGGPDIASQPWQYYTSPPVDSYAWRVTEVQVDYGAPVSTSTWRARSRINGGAWTPWVDVPAAASSGDGSGANENIFVNTGSGSGPDTPAAYDLRVLTSPTPIEDTVVNKPLTARIGASGALVPALYAETGSSGWGLIQSIAAATLGAAWIDEGGTLTYRGRDAMRAGTPVERVVAEESLEDVPWSISADDVADRVEVTYRPTNVTVAGRPPSLTVWESTEVIELRAGQSRTMYVDLPDATGGAGSWAPVWIFTADATKWSRWNAFPNPDLTGAQPPDDALAVESVHVNAYRVRITVRNTTGGTLYVSQLTLRASARFTPSEPVTVSSGATVEAATTPFTLDCGAWVHDDETAAEILQWLAGTLSQPLPVLTGVRVVPDMARRLGSIVKVSDRTTALTAKAIITGIDTSHSPGSLEQRLDLTILATTFDDVDTWLTREGLTTFDALDARLTALGIDTFDKFDDFLSRLGGTL